MTKITESANDCWQLKWWKLWDIIISMIRTLPSALTNDLITLNDKDSQQFDTLKNALL